MQLDHPSPGTGTLIVVGYPDLRLGQNSHVRLQDVEAYFATEFVTRIVRTTVNFNNPCWVIIPGWKCNVLE